jgi:hypothetical protein
MIFHTLRQMPRPESDNSSDTSSAGCDPGAHDEELGSAPNKGVNVAPQEDVKAEDEAKVEEASVAIKEEEEVKD